jgi:hypothetical protein
VGFERYPEYQAKKKAWDNRSEQRNFADPDSRVMMNGGTKSFHQCYNCQTAVDEKAQVIVAAAATQKHAALQQMGPMIQKLSINTDGQMPAKFSADNVYYSEQVCGQIREIRGFRRFYFSGLKKVKAEWDLICLTQNLLKMFRADRFPGPRFSGIWPSLLSILQQLDLRRDPYNSNPTDW